LQPFASEVEGQPSILRRFSAASFPRAAKGSLLVGAGDSYAAAMAGFFASAGTCFALDPYHLASAPEVAKGADVFLISVSGRTASNVAAAKKIRTRARRITAITADEKSELGGVVDRVVRLPMRYVPRTPGLLSFSLSLLAVLEISGCHAECDFDGAFRAAGRDQRIIGWGEGTTYFLGNSLAYPVAMYAAAKTYEFLGMKAHAQQLEEFSHLELFSLGQADVVNAFAGFDPAGASSKLARALARQGYRSKVIPGRGSSKADQLFHAVFASQLSVLRRAEKKGLSRPSFLDGGGRLAASDSMIY